MYTFESRIRYSEVDSNAILTEESLMDYFQDCSALQSEDLSVGHKYLSSRKLGWVVNFWQIDIMRLPRLGEVVVTGTSPYELRGMLGLRNFIMKTPDEEVLAIANSVWTLLDMEQKKPVRVTEEMTRGYEIFPKFEMEYLPRKLEAPKFPGSRGEPVIVSGHHIDTNGHMNNAWYYRIARTTLPEELRGRPAKRLLLEYKRMAFLGDVIAPEYFLEKDGAFVSLSDKAGNDYCRVRFCF